METLTCALGTVPQGFYTITSPGATPECELPLLPAHGHRAWNRTMSWLLPCCCNKMP